MTSQDIDEQLKDLILRQIPTGDSYQAQSNILSNRCNNELVRLILERAKLRIIDSTELYFQKPELRVPFVLSPFDTARLLRIYDGISDIRTVRSERVSDLDFQVHKHAMIQQSVLNICRANVTLEDDMSIADYAYFDGFQPSDYGLFYATRPTLVPIDSELPDCNIPDNSFAIINLYDSSFTISNLYLAMNKERISGSELFLIIPYDVKMWSVKAANVIDGSYSFHWMRTDMAESTDSTLIKSTLLPAGFFDDTNYQYELRIRPYFSNKVLRITRDEFIAVFAHGSERRSFPETRRIAHGFAEVSIINFYPVLEIDSHAGHRAVKRQNIAYTKHIVKRRVYNLKGFLPSINFAESLSPPWEYIIDEKLYEKTRKAAIQTKITRNVVVPLIYHLFAHSSHIVFNGAIVTLQKIMNPELLCQLTEYVLFDVIPIKLKILQAGNAIKANVMINKTDVLFYALRSIAIYAYEKSQDTEGLTKLISELLSNPMALKQKEQTRIITSTIESGPSTSLPVINE